MTLETAIVSILLAISCITTSNAQAAIRHDLDIPAQELGSALVVLAKQARIQVVYSADLVQGHSTGGLSGSMTPEEALDKLLAKTGLRYEFLDEQTVTLSPSSRAGRSTVLRDRPVSWQGDEGLEGMRLALAADERSQDAASDQRPESSDQSSPDPSIAEIVVTGTHIRGLVNKTAPTVVMDRQYIEIG